MPTTTTTYSFNKPVVGADEDDWGGYLNGNWDSVDDLLDGTTPVTGIDINSGTLDGVTIGGTTAGAGTFTTLTATTSITGTLATAAQTNITSVGTLTSLDVGGTVTADGLTVDAAVTTQATAIELNGTSFADTERLSLDFSRGGSQGVRLSLEPDEAQTNGDFVIETGSFGSTSDRLRIEGNGDISFYEDTGTTPKMVWSASAEALGIGGAPNRALDVRSSQQIVGTFHHIDGDTATISFVNTGSTDDNDDQIGTTAGNNFFVRTSGIERMRIDSSGNVGIGTSSPDTALTVSGGDIKATGSLRNQMLVLARTDAANDYEWQIQGGSSGDSQYLAIVDNKGGSSTERMRIDSSGNVGIGGTTTTGWANKQVVLDGGASTSVAYVMVNDTTGRTATDGAVMTLSGSDFYLINRESANMIFRTANTERMRIDSSGNLLVGKTSATGFGSTAGFEVLSDGRILSTVSGDQALALSRTSSDGNIAEFYKDSTTVGSIGSAAGSRLFIGCGDTGVRFAGDLDTIVPWNTNNTLRDAAIDLGEATGRFKDLYLSGGVYLGGTGAANKLDDYEEGSWTPVWTASGTNPTVTYSSQIGRYTKVGNMVYAWGVINGTPTSAGTGSIFLSGLPFNPSAVREIAGGQVGYCTHFDSGYTPQSIHADNNNAYCWFYYNSSHGGYINQAVPTNTLRGGVLYFSTIYGVY